jgi:putative transposase
MSRSAKGSVETPGKMVKQKAGLNRSILDQGWGDFARMCDYKQEWRRGRVIYINPKNTSRKCPDCGHTSKDNRLTQASFVCVKCNYTANADYVAALNIKAAGQAVLACGDIKPVAA